MTWLYVIGAIYCTSIGFVGGLFLGLFSVERKPPADLRIYDRRTGVVLRIRNLTKPDAGPRRRGG